MNQALLSSYAIHPLGLDQLGTRLQNRGDDSKAVREIYFATKIEATEPLGQHNRPILCGVLYNMCCRRRLRLTSL